MSVSSEIKEFLCTGIKRNPCCAAAFEAGRRGEAFKEACAGCRAAFVGGIFVGFGTMTDPQKDFHLDFKLPRGIAGKAAFVLDEEGLTPHASLLRNGRVRLYYKVSSLISDLLTYMGAGKYALEVLEAEVIKNVRSRENRRSNAELANIDRAATAAAEQIRAIEALKRRGALTHLPEELALTAKIREENPFLPLDELRLEFSPPISKSGLSHRLKRIIEEADKLEGRV